MTISRGYINLYISRNRLYIHISNTIFQNILLNLEDDLAISFGALRMSPKLYTPLSRNAVFRVEEENVSQTAAPIGWKLSHDLFRYTYLSKEYLYF